MIEDGLTIGENKIISPLKEEKKSFSTNNNQSIPENDIAQNNHGFEHKEEMDLMNDLEDFDADSGVSSTRNSSTNAVASVSGTTLIKDDDFHNEQHHPTTNSSYTGIDNTDRRSSDSSSLTDFTQNPGSSEFQLHSQAPSRTSSMTLPPLITSSNSTNSKHTRSTHSNGSETKEKSGVRHLLRKIFKSSSSSASRHQASARVTSDKLAKNVTLNVDTERGTAYRPLSPLPVTQGPIRLLVLRHGERLDRYYSSQWLRQAFDKDGHFCRFSPILPETLPFRASIRDFDLDPPLTYRGLKDAFHTGTVLRDKGIHINYCYSSPALRCVQTASKILEGLQLQTKIKIRIEPGLFECTGWYTLNERSTVLTMPRFMTKKELSENKYLVDKNYHEQMTMAEVGQLENELEFYQRCHAVTASILKMHETEYITHIQQGQTTQQQPLHVLFVAHAPSLETCTRKLCGGKFRPDTLPHVIRNVDFLTMTVIEKTDNNADKWIFRRSSFYGDEL